MSQKIDSLIKGAIGQLNRMIDEELFDVEATYADGVVYVRVPHEKYEVLRKKAFPSLLSKFVRYTTTAQIRFYLGEHFELPGTNICVVDEKSKGMINEQWPKLENIADWVPFPYLNNRRIRSIGRYI